MAMGMDWTNLKACQMAMVKYIKPQPQLIRTTSNLLELQSEGWTNLIASQMVKYIKELRD